MPLPTSTDANASGDLLFSLPIIGRDGSNMIISAEIRVYADSTVAAGKIPTRFEFWTQTTAGTLTKALTIDSSQNMIVPNLLKLSGIETALTAHAGGGQASAQALSASKAIHDVSTVGSANDSVVLPAATGSGAVHWIKNSAAANSLQLYGLSNDTIDGVASGTGVAVAAGKSRIVVDSASGKWLSISGA